MPFSGLRLRNVTNLERTPFIFLYLPHPNSPGKYLGPFEPKIGRRSRLRNASLNQRGVGSYNPEFILPNQGTGEEDQ